MAEEDELVKALRELDAREAALLKDWTELQARRREVQAALFSRIGKPNASGEASTGIA